MTIFYILIGHWFISLFCQSFFLHRYSSHQMFKMNKFWERFFYFLTYLSQGPSFLNPKSYSILHQRHHANSDTPKDPHSPAHSKSIWDMMMKTYHLYNRLLNREHSNKEGKQNYPQWKSLDKFAQSRLSLAMWIIIYIGLYSYLKVDPIYYLLLPIHFFIGPIQGAIVNWFGHKVGYRNFALLDQSKNTLPIDFALMGELYQNNHHKFGDKINFAHKWYEIDLTYQISLFLKKIRIIETKENGV